MKKCIVRIAVMLACAAAAGAGAPQFHVDDVIPVKTTGLVLVVESEPCEVFVDDVLQGTTPVLISPASGLQRVLVRGTLQVARIVLDVNAADLSVTRVQPRLHPLTGMLTVGTDVPGAQVFLDGVLLGVTPLSLANLQAGRYDVSVRPAGGAQVDRVVEVPPDGTGRLDLVVAPGHRLVLEPAPPDGTRMLVHGAAGAEPRTVVFPDVPLLPAGPTKFTVLAKGSEPFEFTIDPSQTGRQPVAYAPRPSLGTLRLTGLPEGSVVSLGGGAGAPAVGTMDLSATPGVWSVRVEAPGFLAASTIVLLESGTTTELDLAFPKDPVRAVRATKAITWGALASGAVLAGGGLLLNGDGVAMGVTSSYAGYSAWKIGTFAAFDIGLAMTAVAVYLLYLR